MPDSSTKACFEAELDDIAVAIANMTDHKTSAYQAACNRLIERAYEYLEACNDKAVYAFADTLVETLQKCIQDFIPENGQFSHYFNHRWKLAKAGETDVTESLGVGLTDWDVRNIRKYHKLRAKITAQYSDLSEAETDELVADAMEVSVETVRKYAENSSYTVVSDTMVGDDGEEYSLIDMVVSTPGADAQLLQTGGVEIVLQAIDTAFDDLQNRQKPLLAAALTNALAEAGFNAEGRTFFDAEIYQLYVKSGKKLSGREIAARFGKDEAHLSRAWGKFKEKLEAAYNEKIR